MKKILLLAILAAFTFTASFAQCEQDQFWIDNYVYGVFPYPPDTDYDDGTTSEGIPNAIVGLPYTFDFTIIVPEVLPASVVSSLTDGAIEADLPLDEVIVTNSDAIGLPAGFTFTTDAENWTFVGGGTYCARIEGTGTAAMDEVDVAINANAISPALGGVPYPVSFDGYKFAIAVGTGAEDLADISAGISNFPNPFENNTTINFYAKEAGVYSISVYNVTGAQIQELEIDAVTGENNYDFDGSDLDAGIYLYTVSDGISTATSRMIVNK